MGVRVFTDCTRHQCLEFEPEISLELQWESGSYTMHVVSVIQDATHEDISWAIWDATLQPMGVCCLLFYFTPQGVVACSFIDL